MYEKYVALRDERGMTDTAVSLATGIPRASFTDWKQGKCKPGLNATVKLAEYFGVPMEYFLTDPGSGGGESMTQKEMKEILENVDQEHGWHLDSADSYSCREFRFRLFERDTVIAELEDYWRPALFGEERRVQAVVHYYFLKDGADCDLPLSYFRKSKTEVLNLLKEAGRKA